MTALLVLWQSSLVLCAIGLFALGVLLFARTITGRRDGRRSLERARAMPLLLQGALDSAAQPPRRAIERIEIMRLTMELVEMVRGPDREVLLANAAALGVKESLRQSSRSRMAKDRLLAAEALAWFPEEADRVREMLDDSNPDVRLGAALALAQSGAAPPVRELIRRLGLGTTERSLLVVQLMRDLVETDAPGVEGVLDDWRLPDALRLAAIDALAATGRIEHTPLMCWMAVANEEDRNLLVRVYRALGRIGHPDGHRAIMRGIDHEAWQVRAAAAQAAGASAYVGSCSKLGELLGDPEWWVRFRAGEALFRLGAGGRDMLKEVASDGSGFAREAAIATLAERAPH